MTTQYSVAIIGGGFSGICAAIKLAENDITDFVIIDRQPDFGGTWLWNSYPGAAVDTPSSIYSFSFEKDYPWSRPYGQRDEIVGYAHYIALKYGLRRYARFGHGVTRMEFDEIADEWELLLDDNSVVRAQYVIGGFGPFNFQEPIIPEVPGRDDFAGVQFHSSAWDHTVDLRGKRVVSVGSGASAVQYIPAIAPEVDQLAVLFRTPPYVLPRLDPPYDAPGFERARRSRVRRRIDRAKLLAMSYLVYRKQFQPHGTRQLQQIALDHLAEQVSDPGLREMLTPDYEFACKRPTNSEQFYPSLQRENVQVTRSPLHSIEGDAVITADGARYPADVIVWGTGFHHSSSLGAWDVMDVVGLRGVNLREAFAKLGGPEAYLGVAINGFPNFFVTHGPNGGFLQAAGGILPIEFEIGIAVRTILAARRRQLTRVDVRQDRQRAWTDRAHTKLAGGVWSTGGCTSYFIDESGVNRAAYPYFFADLWVRAHLVTLRDFNTSSRYKPHGPMKEIAVAPY